MLDRSLGLRDKNGVELHDGDQVEITFYDRRKEKAGVHYDKSVAAWMVGKHYILNIGRDKGTVLEVLTAMDHAKAVTKRPKGKKAV